MINDSDIEKAIDWLRDTAESCAKKRAERLYLRAAIQAIACRLAGEFDHPALMAYGPLRGSDHGGIRLGVGGRPR